MQRQSESYKFAFIGTKKIFVPASQIIDSQDFQGHEIETGIKTPNKKGYSFLPQR